MDDMHGTHLIDRVIERVARYGWPTADAPVITDPVPLPPDVLAGLNMPGGKPLSPSIERWLAFDASWLAALGWFEDPRHPVMDTGMRLGETTAGMYGSTAQDESWVGLFSDFEGLLPGYCLPLLGGCDSQDVLYVGEPDSTGEYPVLVTDLDDTPYVAVMYPGLDVYLAELAGVIQLEFEDCTSLIRHPAYGDRMREHASRTGLGPYGRDVQSL
ncbi:hypothetical protein ACF064_35215 [Streptomyces sp. NPDC015492]|uniref:hypothetical protein n=1 Tax=Streptomyces sp. NPDC015492 TaxID=3364958 RepID=UPI0036F8B533